MTPAPSDPELEALLQEYHAAGGVVEWSRFDFGPPETVGLAAHRQVAEATVRAAAAASGPVGRLSADEIPPDAAPRRITARDFFGPLWAPTREVLIVRGRSTAFGHAWFYANDAEERHNVLDHISWAPEVGTGYAYAFGEPPYSMDCSTRRCSELFVAINRRVFPYGVEAPNVTIYEWPTHWSPYFDAGHEGWGSFLWTVSWPGWRVVGVTASTTD